eukprot:4205419-Amphidinium_carterae.1
MLTVIPFQTAKSSELKVSSSSCMKSGNLCNRAKRNARMKRTYLTTLVTRKNRKNEVAGNWSSRIKVQSTTTKSKSGNSQDFA